MITSSHKYALIHRVTFSQANTHTHDFTNNLKLVSYNPRNLFYAPLYLSAQF